MVFQLPASALQGLEEWTQRDTEGSQANNNDVGQVSSSVLAPVSSSVEWEYQLLPKRGMSIDSV